MTTVISLLYFIPIATRLDMKHLPVSSLLGIPNGGMNDRKPRGMQVVASAIHNRMVETMGVVVEVLLGPTLLKSRQGLTILLENSQNQPQAVSAV